MFPPQHHGDDVLKLATDHEQIRSDGSLFTIALLGSYHDGMSGIDWTLPIADPTARGKASALLQQLGAQIYYAPNVSTANGKRVLRSAMQEAIAMDSDVRVFGNKDERGDVIALDAGEGVVYNPAGCGFILGEREEHSCVAHGAWRSFVDDKRVLNQLPWRLPESVTETVVRHLESRQRRAEDIRIWLRGFIRPEKLRFPLKNSPWEEVNRLRLDYIVNHWGTECIDLGQDDYGLDLPLLGAAQFEKLGVKNVDLTNPYLTGGNVWEDGTKGAPRNFLAIVRH